MAVRLLTRWCNGNKRKPEQILFLRDGVSEGQFGQVLEGELKALREAAAELCISPKITFVVLQKRCVCCRPSTLMLCPYAVSTCQSTSREFAD